MICLNEETASDNADIISINKNILRYMHFKEMDKFKDQYITRRVKNKNEAFKNYSEEGTLRTVNCIHEEDTESQSDDHRQYLNYAWKSIWGKISDKIERLSIVGDIEFAARNYTVVLKTHLTHNVNVDIKCFPAILYCNIPSVVQKIFDNGLIEADDKVFQIYYNS